MIRQRSDEEAMVDERVLGSSELQPAIATASTIIRTMKPSISAPLVDHTTTLRPLQPVG